MAILITVLGNYVVFFHSEAILIIFFFFNTHTLVKIHLGIVLFKSGVLLEFLNRLFNIIYG